MVGKRSTIILWTSTIALFLYQTCLASSLFDCGINVSVGDAPRSVAIGDLDGDGVFDLATANSSTNDVSILLGNGDGTFQQAVSYVAGDEPQSVAIGDLDGDGVLDLATANSSTNDVSILLGNGDGTFQQAVSYVAGDGPRSVTIEDLDGDGVLDLSTANSNGKDVSILSGNGDGTFQAAVFYSAGDGIYDGGNYPISVAIGNMDNDGALDLAVANLWSNDVSILLSNGDDAFLEAVIYDAGVTANVIYEGPYSVAIGDLDGDGVLDLVTANTYNYPDGGTSWHGSPSDLYSNDVSIFLGNGDGTFQQAVFYSAGWDARSVAIGELDGDGVLDLAVANSRTNDVSILLGNGDGTFQQAVSYVAGDGPQSVAIGELDGDGVLDLAVANLWSDDVSILWGNGDGTFKDADSNDGGDCSETDGTFASGSGGSTCFISSMLK